MPWHDMTPHDINPHYTTSHHITTRHITSCHITSRHVTSHHSHLHADRVLRRRRAPHHRERDRLAQQGRVKMTPTICHGKVKRITTSTIARHGVRRNDANDTSWQGEAHYHEHNRPARGASQWRQRCVSWQGQRATDSAIARRARAHACHNDAMRVPCVRMTSLCRSYERGGAWRTFVPLALAAVAATGSLASYYGVM